jgi:hypothetical protein
MVTEREADPLFCALRIELKRTKLNSISADLIFARLLVHWINGARSMLD